MKISFVIPAHNEEKYIGKCLESILREIKRGNFDAEVIAVNNASVDKTREVILAYPEVLLVDEARKGLPQARQAGFLASTGEIIANVDADSLLAPGWIEKAIKEFSQNKKLVALSGPYIYYDAAWWTNCLVWVYYLVGYVVHFLTQYVLRNGAMLQGGNFVLRRSALEKIGGFDVRIDFYGEDTDIAKRIQKRGQVKFSFFFPMRTSARRFSHEGLVLTALRYVINYFWIIVFHRPFSKKHNSVR
ncbi:MAG: glycosyltransferase family 2 protein [Candidatus Moranbacteria bacterium]|nr:glycosyltransferase family 2 protein [Candidatus Moranbacteria bacterium]